MKNIKEVIENFKKKIEEHQNQLNGNDEIIELSFNKDWGNLSEDNLKIKYIVVGDNPGKNERENNPYFIGNSGQSLRNFFEEKLNITFNTEVLVFNKTPIYTNATEKLKNIQRDFLVKSLEISASTICEIQKELNIPILIFGSSKLNTIFKPFWDCLIKNIEAKMIKVYGHPSNGAFFKEWEERKNMERLNPLKMLIY